ncbi:MAG: hypothetical protein OEZ22_09175 [Spirochaetia bacterium]|nr:hypothetical protein [Spirochaetia bacterium]
MIYFNKLKIIFIIYFIIGCISIEKEIYSKKNTIILSDLNKIEVKYDYPENKYEIIGRLRIRYGYGYKRSYILKKIKEEAYESGADGIIFQKFEEFNESWSLSGEESGQSFSKKNREIEVLMYRYLQE